MKKLKVLMLGWEFPPFKSGGLGTYLYGFTKELSKLGVEITFIMPYTGKKIKCDFIRIIQADGFEAIGITTWLSPYVDSKSSLFECQDNGNGETKAVYGRNFFEEVEYYNRRAIEIGSKIECDIIHCHDWMTFPAGIALKKILNKPLIVTVHSTEYDRTGFLFPDMRIVSIEKAGMEAADAVITISNYEKKILVERYGIDPNKIYVVYNAIDPEAYRKILAKKPVNEKVVLYLGRLTLQKGVNFLLEAAKKVLERRKDVRFVIVGKGSMMPELIRKSIELGIADKVHFTGFVPDVTLYYSIADVFVMPSVSEPFGLTALEALACETPVIVSKQSGVSEVLKNCFKVDFWDTQELANKILGLLSYKALHKEMLKNGKNEIKNFRTWHDVAVECLQIYARVLSCH